MYDIKLYMTLVFFNTAALTSDSDTCRTVLIAFRFCCLPHVDYIWIDRTAEAAAAFRKAGNCAESRIS